MARSEQLVLTRLDLEGLQRLLGGIDAAGLPLRFGVAPVNAETALEDLTIYLLSQEEVPSLAFEHLLAKAARWVWSDDKGCGARLDVVQTGPKETILALRTITGHGNRGPAVAPLQKLLRGECDDEYEGGVAQADAGGDDFARSDPFSALPEVLTLSDLESLGIGRRQLDIWVRDHGFPELPRAEKSKRTFPKRGVQAWLECHYGKGLPRTAPGQSQNDASLRTRKSGQATRIGGTTFPI